jgi:hypothetical protein
MNVFGPNQQLDYLTLFASVSCRLQYIYHRIIHVHQKLSSSLFTTYETYCSQLDLKDCEVLVREKVRTCSTLSRLLWRCRGKGRKPQFILTLTSFSSKNICAFHKIIHCILSVWKTHISVQNNTMFRYSFVSLLLFLIWVKLVHIFKH